MHVHTCAHECAHTDTNGEDTLDVEKTLEHRAGLRRGQGVQRPYSLPFNSVISQ